ATSSSLNFPNGIALDKKGNVFISDFGDSRIRKINSSGIISTLAGNGTYMNGYTGDGGPADTTSIGQPMAVACDKYGNIYIADGNSLIRKVDTLGIISTVAGSGNSFGGISGDGGPSTAALLGAPGGIAFDSEQNMYITDYFNNVIRIIDTSGIINSFASFSGNGFGYSGDWGPANNAKLFLPTGISTDINGDLYIADEGNDVVRKIGKCIPTTPEICMVAVDSLSLNNVIYWDKSLYAADTFYVYRDTANYNYALIGKVPYDSLGQFVDTVRTLYSANGDPNASSWRYKISYGFPCPSGRSMSQMSPWHQTLFMINSGGSFMWTMYQIEGQSLPVSGLVNYLFKRDNLSDGNWNVIQALSASSAAYTDQNYNQYQSTASWRVETFWGVSCDPTRSIINTTRSNVRGIVAPPTAVGSNENNFSEELTVFPIPVSNSENLFVKFNENRISSVEIIELSGRLLLQKSNLNEPAVSFDINSISAGTYFVNVFDKSGKKYSKRILIQ
ncbi:MAG: T9SS type A sorting domain-containing protein, partial [Bacteroidota bacterium]